MSSIDEMKFKGDNPGAVQYGNFINYYQFHPAHHRIKMLPLNVWDMNVNATCLDIGCNAGDLTVALHEYLSKTLCKNVRILGIDLDPTLILRAQENSTYPQAVTYECMDIMDEMQQSTVQTYLHNLNISRFSTTFCFSVTMWIHLNHGDEGLRRFLKYVCDISEMVVIEPQPWKCYRAAVKRMRLATNEFPLFKKLKIRGDVETVIEGILTDACFVKKHETPSTEWGRKILFYVRNT